MFRSFADGLRSCLASAGDLLGGIRVGRADESLRQPLEAQRGASARAYHLAHPHRRSLRWQRSRRPGTVPDRPAHCISTVRERPAPRPIRFP